MAQMPANAGSLVGTRLGKYDVLALLALGGTAEIYLARIGGEAGFEKYVVIKCLHDHLADDAEFVRMFLDEARLGAQLDHSNIVQTLELGEEDGRYYMVMEYLAGMSLALIARKARQRVPGGRIPVDLVLAICVQACAGLHYAHCRSTSDRRPLNIVHRDVSPQNLVISFEGMLKIVDFGIAKAAVRETKTKSGTIKGKFAYMSPEQCLAQQVDRRTDIFALGTVMHELVTGRRLFKRSSTYETYQAIVSGGVPAPSAVNHELDPGLDEVIMRALQYKKEDRYPTAEALGESIISYLHKRGKSVGPSDIGRFFDQFYQQEINEYSTRMRELIEGRSSSTIDELGWDEPGLDSEAAARMPDEPPDLGAEIGSAEDEMEGESTRIELNPLERVQNLHAQFEGRPGTDDQTFDRAESEGATAIASPMSRAGAQPPVVGQRAAPGGKHNPAALGRRGPQQPPAVQPMSRTLSPDAARMAPAPSPAPSPAQAAAAKKTLFGAPGARVAAARAAGAPPAKRVGGPVGLGAPPQQRAITDQAPGGAPPVAHVAEEATVMPIGNEPSWSNVAPPPPAAPLPPAPSAPVPAVQQPFPGSGPGQQPFPGSGPGPQPFAGAAPAPFPQYAHGPQSAPAPMGQAGPIPNAPALPIAPPQTPQGGEAFPPIHTPTAFRQRGEMIPDIEQPQPPSAMGGDLALLANERARAESGDPNYVLLAAAFLVSAGVGLGITVLIGLLVT